MPGIDMVVSQLCNAAAKKLVKKLVPPSLGPAVKKSQVSGWLGPI